MVDVYFKDDDERMIDIYNKVFKDKLDNYFDDDKVCTDYLGYESLFNSYPCEIIINISVGSYQGEDLCVYKDGDSYGFHVFGWGSCSYCDELENAIGKGKEALKELWEDMYKEIKWVDGKDNFIQWLKEKDWSTEWYGSLMTKDNLFKIIKALEE